MPAGSADHGLVTATCAFGTRDADGRFRPLSPTVTARAAVPGAVWTTTGRVVECCGRQGVGVPNATVLLVDPDTNETAARATADAHGEFAFPDLAVGHYTPVVLGPWRVVRTHEGPLFEAVRGSTTPQLIAVEPGPEVPDPDATAPGDTPAGGGGPTRDALATTGASVLGLGLLGSALLAFGVGARAAGRRPA